MGKPKKVDGPVKANQMINFLSSMAPDTGTKYLGQRLLDTAVSIETMSKGWAEGEKLFAQLGMLSNDEKAAQDESLSRHAALMETYLRKKISARWAAEARRTACWVN